MTPLLWVPLLWPLLPTITALLLGQDHCSLRVTGSSENASALLDSLECHNDYESYVQCQWGDHAGVAPLQLWFKAGDDRNLCVPYGSPERARCRYETGVFAIGVEHTVFFAENQSERLCSSARPRGPLDLHRHVRARSPGDLSSHGEADGGRRLRWSAPYPSASSLSRNITYQLGYRPDAHDPWATEIVANTSAKVERRLLLPGRRYQARVRARASVGQWSHWSPVVTWETQEDTPPFPSLHCVLDGEREVTCSWEVSRELAHFVTYRLTCRHGLAASSETCCTDPTVGSERGSGALRYSCSLAVADPARLPLLELEPTRTAKTFKAYQHIRPNPPRQLTVKEKHGDWIVEWSERSTGSKLTLSHQVCYYETQEQACSNLLNVVAGSASLTLRGASLSPSQRYRVKVRSLVEPGDGSRYQGTPSEWTDPVDWTTQPGTWSLNSVIYVVISVCVVTVFFALYRTIPACQRRAVLWVDSVPSPGKSQILAEIKSTTLWLSHKEVNSMCKVQHLDHISTCSLSSNVGPNPKKCTDLDEGFCHGEVTVAETSSISFSGPYIFCQPAESLRQAAESRCHEEKEDKPAKTHKPPFPLRFDTTKREGYVCLPSPAVSRSTQDLASAGSQDAMVPGGPQRHGPDPRGASRTDHTPADTPAGAPCWPQGGTAHASGYCHLPSAK